MRKAIQARLVWGQQKGKGPWLLVTVDDVTAGWDGGTGLAQQLEQCWGEGHADLSLGGIQARAWLLKAGFCWPLACL